MLRTVPHKLDSPNNDDCLSALALWGGDKLLYTRSHMRLCVPVATSIRNNGNPDRTLQVNCESGSEQQ